jgi:hypothetical protein
MRPSRRPRDAGQRHWSAVLELGDARVRRDLMVVMNLHSSESRNSAGRYDVLPGAE